MDGAGGRISVVVPVHEDAATLRPLADRLARALAGNDWRLRLVIDASADESTTVARALATRSPRISVGGLTQSGGGDDALVRARRRGRGGRLGLPRRRARRPSGGDPADARPPVAGRRRGRVRRAAGRAAHVRDAVLTAVQDAGAPCVALAVTRSGAALATVPVPRGRRPAPRGLVGVQHSVRPVAWAVRATQGR